MDVRQTLLSGLLVIEPKVFGDSRGFFLETWQHERYRDAGIHVQFCQDNVSRSRKGVLRGLHFQRPFDQGKLVWVIEGEVFDVAVDIRYGSPTFGQWHGEVLSSETHRQMYVPPGFAHGFCVLSESALFCYKCTDVYHPETEKTLAWDDPALAIAWPIAQPAISVKDQQGRRLAELDPSELPVWTPSA